MLPDSVVPIRAVSLAKRYGRHEAIRDVSVEVERGQICALLGPNGAGKTTTMRLLVGLARPDLGTSELFGIPTGLGARVLGRVGVVIDGPGFVPHLTGLRNLQLSWTSAGHSWPPPGLDTALDLAGLGSSLRRKTKTYSTGMAQRLMLAQAVMKQPDLLILDEPATGLDPGEVRNLRTYLTNFAAGGGTVLLSTHVLAEVEAVASHVVVIHNRTVAAAGALTDFLKPGDAPVSGGARRLEDVFLDLVDDDAAR
jgi:ABC-type multidrug transport system ATPase subunit